MTEISKQYRFSDFTLNNYEKILQLALKNYKFQLFEKFKKNTAKTILLRHDVEFSVPIALKMAEIEASLGILSTYFIQIHSDFYNALEKNNFSAFKRIQSLGHQIGLHFDTHFWEINSLDMLKHYMEIDKKTFKAYFNIVPKVFSFHNTNSFILTLDDEKYAGMLNVYSKSFKNEFGYCSDSTGYWRYEILEQRILEAKDEVLQVLIHDGMWQEVPLPPRRRVYKVIDEQAEFLKQSYDETLKKFGAVNVDLNGPVQ